MTLNSPVRTGKSTLVSTPPKTTGSLTAKSVQDEIKKWFKSSRTRQLLLNFVDSVGNDEDKLARIMSFIGLRSPAPSNRKLKVTGILNQMKEDPKLKDSYAAYAAHASEATESGGESGESGVEGEEGEDEEGEDDVGQSQESGGAVDDVSRQLPFNNNNATVKGASESQKAAVDAAAAEAALHASYTLSILSWGRA